MITYFRAIVIGLLQGVTELFPISSLGHSILVPALLGWTDLVQSQSASESPYLAFLVGLHVATAIALLILFREDWKRIVAGLLRSLARRRIADADERLAWLLVIATIPTGLMGLLFEHQIRTIFAKPLAAACFLTLNGVILLLGERYRRAAGTRPPAPLEPDDVDDQADSRSRLGSLRFGEALVVGFAQIGALFAGISRSGITMVAGLVRGLDHEDAARFSFLLATPIILAAGLYKLPDLLGPNGDGVRGQVLAGSLAAGISAYVAARFLLRFFETRTLTPFAIYCLVMGGLSIIRFGLL